MYIRRLCIFLSSLLRTPNAAGLPCRPSAALPQLYCIVSNLLTHALDTSPSESSHAYSHTGRPGTELFQWAIEMQNNKEYNKTLRMSEGRQTPLHTYAKYLT